MNTSDSPPPEMLSRLHSHAFSGVISVIDPGREKLLVASGLSNREREIPNLPSTRFPCASVGKIFTALCVARLVEDGFCRFDQPVIEILPSLKSHFDSDVSLAALLSHTSGLGDYIDDDAPLPFSRFDVSQLDCPTAFLPHVLRAPRGVAGEFHYSSAGFILLGFAIEVLTGAAFPDAIARFVIEPAGLQSTGYPRMNSEDEDIAIGYLDDGSPNLGHIPIRGGPDGGIVTNVGDLEQLFASLRGCLLGESSRKFLWARQNRLSPMSDYGHGFYITTIRNRPWYGHTGSDPGISARVAFSVDSDSSVIVLCNRERVAFEAFRMVVEWLGPG